MLGLLLGGERAEERPRQQGRGVRESGVFEASCSLLLTYYKRGFKAEQAGKDGS